MVSPRLAGGGGRHPGHAREQAGAGPGPRRMLCTLAAHKGTEDYPGTPDYPNVREFSHAELLLAVTDETFWRLPTNPFTGADRDAGRAM